MLAKTRADIVGLRQVGVLVSETIARLVEAATPGISTRELDAIAADAFRAAGARSGPILTYDYPGTICISVNDEVVHGVPGRRRLRARDLVTFDVAAELGGYHADAAHTVVVGDTTEAAARVMDATSSALSAGIAAARAGRPVREIGAAVESEAQRCGCTVVHQLTGHGIGRRMHEAPTIYNWPNPDAKTLLRPGMVFTIEPMLVLGAPQIKVRDDGWTIVTRDKSLSAHEEHTILVLEEAAVVLTQKREPEALQTSEGLSALGF